jgi:hypothetical protein
MTESGASCTVLEVNDSLPITSVAGSHKILAELLRRDGDVENFCPSGRLSTKRVYLSIGDSSREMWVAKLPKAGYFCTIVHWHIRHRFCSSIFPGLVL